jgi:hypothetical protein
MIFILSPLLFVFGSASVLKVSLRHHYGFLPVMKNYYLPHTLLAEYLFLNPNKKC